MPDLSKFTKNHWDTLYCIEDTLVSGEESIMRAAEVAQDLRAAGMVLLAEDAEMQGWHTATLTDYGWEMAGALRRHRFEHPFDDAWRDFRPAQPVSTLIIPASPEQMALPFEGGLL